MDLRERFEDAQEALRAAIHGALINVWTALPGIVQSFDAHALTVTVRPAIQGVVRRHDLSDGFAFIGPFSQQTKIKGIHTQAVQLRSDDGATYIELNPATQKIK